jgi:hypothetical protein
MLAVTYGGKTYNVDVQKMDKTPPPKPKSNGGTRRKQKRSKPTRRIKR